MLILKNQQSQQVDFVSGAFMKPKQSIQKRIRLESLHYAKISTVH